MALYRHLASGVTPGEVFNFSLWSNSNISLSAAQTAWSASLSGFWTGAVAALFANEVSITEASTAEVTIATGRQVTRVSDVVSLPGTSTAEMLPFQCAEAVSLRTFFTAATARGRFYLPPVTVANVAGGRLLTTAVNTLADAVQGMLQGMALMELTPVVYSRTARAAVTINRIIVDNVIDTQRRRRNKLIPAGESRVI